jgi:SAM-dependent methyltransferase
VRDGLPDARAHFVQANAEELPFAAGAFRVIYGKAILHHLDLDLAAAEVDRLLPAGGRATFAEPLARHPLIVLGRRLTPRLRTRDERPFGLEEMERFGDSFRRPATQPFFLLAPLAYLLRLLPGGESVFQAVHAWLAQIDKHLFRRYPSMRRWAWYGVVRIEK